MKYITVVVIETKYVQIFVCSVNSDGEINILSQETWVSTPYLTDTSGQRLIEEIARRVSAHWKVNKSRADYVAVSMPGTLRDRVTVISSSRLGIRKPVEFSTILGKSLKTPCSIFHDTECLITGEIHHGDYFHERAPSNFVYVFVDEGIGSNIFINGDQYLGMGTAGLLGRLIVQPEGAYFSALRASGTLESYSCRPSVSRRLVEVYHSELNKKGSDLLSDDAQYSKFRQTLKTISESDDWSQMQYDRIASGINDNDPIALHVIDHAAKYLGFSINAVITIINPEIIILGGGMITQLPSFAQKVISYVRQFSWPIAWNNTEILVSKHGREMQVYGSVMLGLETLE